LQKNGELEIVSDKFSADGIKGRSTFSGNVSVKRGTDFIKSDTLEVFFDNKNKPEVFSASGGVTFDIELEKGTMYKGKAKSITYDAKKGIYTLNGDVEIVESKNNNRISGENIVLDKNNKKADVTSKENKPVKFIFNINEDKKD